MVHTDRQQLLSKAKDLLNAGRAAEAEALLRQLITLAPNHAELLNQTALVCYQQQKHAEAEELLRVAIRNNASAAMYHVNLGEVLRAQNRLPEALESLQRAVLIDPKNVLAHYNLGVVLKKLNRIEDATKAYLQAVKIKPDYSAAFNNLASILHAQGRVDEAADYLRKNLAIAPSAALHSNLLYTMWFDPVVTQEQIIAEHASWAERWVKPLEREIRPLENNLDPGRRLRIGYVSPDFREHVIALFMQPILHHRNRGQFEVFCYSDVANPDFMTERLRADSDTWVPTTSMSDAALAKRICADRIDILVDLTAQMVRNRLLMFARRAAPVQVSYLAYAETTGLPTMDYRLSDIHLDPASAKSFGPEEIVRLPETYWCYQPQIDVPTVSTPKNGPITFACYNNCAKINRPVISLWSEILKLISNARIRLVAIGGETGNGHLKRTFEDHGIDAARVEVLSPIAYRDYFSLYEDVHIALDPFPYNGGTTTLDALYMGVPVITLAGKSGMSRAGVSILTNAGMTELIASSEDEYTKIAIALSHDHRRLSELRGSLRPKLMNSTLMNAPRFVRNLEMVFRTMWQKHCAIAGKA
jgi:protein O-GlcNAc transferase